MFGALNRFIGRLDSDTQQYSSNTPGDNSFGFQVLRNKDPDLPLEPWFDFIIGINGRLIVRFPVSKTKSILRRNPNNLHLSRTTPILIYLQPKSTIAPEGTCHWRFGVQRLVHYSRVTGAYGEIWESNT